VQDVDPSKPAAWKSLDLLVNTPEQENAVIPNDLTLGMPPSHALCLCLTLCPCPFLFLLLWLWLWLCLCLWSLSVSGSAFVCLCLCVGRKRGRRCCRHLLVADSDIFLLQTSCSMHLLVADIFLTQRDASKVCMALRVQVLWCVCSGVERGSSKFFTASPLLDGPVSVSIQIQIYTNMHLVYRHACSMNV
jgi:hypothetical protein